MPKSFAEITNDSLTPLRSRLLGSSERPVQRRRRTAHRSRLPGSEGRWSLLERWLPTPLPSSTERLAFMVDALLDRYGVLPREAMNTEVLATFSELYPVLKAMQEAGKLRRGFFVNDLAATQFAQPGADDRLRLLRDPNPKASSITLAATDPANPYGSILPWPVGDARPQRAAGARVFMLDGALIGYISRSEHSLLTFVAGSDSERRLRALIEGLKRLVEGYARRALVIEEIDTRPALETCHRQALERAGFVATGDGFFYRPEHLPGTNHRQ